MYPAFSPLGLVAVDITGAVAGRVEGTYPLDGSEPEFAMIRLIRGSFGPMRMVPLEGTVAFDECLQFPYTFSEMDDAPNPEESRWEYESVDRARAYW